MLDGAKNDRQAIEVVRVQFVENQERTGGVGQNGFVPPQSEEGAQQLIRGNDAHRRGHQSGEVALVPRRQGGTFTGVSFLVEKPGVERGRRRSVLEDDGSVGQIEVPG